ncbi:hypothetical protein SAMD00023353_1401170 [Rosellinia necatrix]|uniref:Uncharacterized protein n=1 Tax=Rosellinia necatrix TaxID=77044 RepID=A0A1W2TCX6_ROSNE|nr:hypothetical protein SAMD00023353_1401170 [Rosellinia necatrix]
MSPGQQRESQREGYTKQLKSRKKTNHTPSEVDKWTAIFRILFPHVPGTQIPSPFHDYEQPATLPTVREFKDYIIREIRLRILEILPPDPNKGSQMAGQGFQDQVAQSFGVTVEGLYHEYREIHQQGGTLATTPGFSESQDYTSFSSSPTQSQWLKPLENNDTTSDLMDFNFDFTLPCDKIACVGDIPEVPKILTGPADCELGQFNFGCGSSGPERPFR